MHMYCWYVQPRFLAVAQAANVADARRMVLEEIGDPDESVPERQYAKRFVTERTPDIWFGPNAEFVITDSAELRECEAQSEKRFQLLKLHGISEV